MSVKYFLGILLLGGIKAQDPILEIDTGSIMGRVINYEGKDLYFSHTQHKKTSVEDPEIQQLSNYVYHSNLIKLQIKIYNIGILLTLCQ